MKMKVPQGPAIIILDTCRHRQRTLIIPYLPEIAKNTNVADIIEAAIGSTPKQSQPQVEVSTPNPIPELADLFARWPERETNSATDDARRAQQ
jgi:hypothetical protein